MNVVDVKTGRTSVNPDKLFKKDGDTIVGCYHNTRGLWQIAYHPGKNSLYVPFHDQCLSMQAVEFQHDRLWAAHRRHASGRRPEGVHGHRQDRRRNGRDAGDLLAAAGTNGSALTTAGDLVFFGDLNRRLRALDADSGKVLWETIVGGMIVNSTITYAVNGKQYVMVYTGAGQSVTAGPLGLTGKVMPPRCRTQRDLRFCVALTTKGMDHPKLKTALVTRGHTQWFEGRHGETPRLRVRIRGRAGHHQCLPADGPRARVRRLARWRSPPTSARARTASASPRCRSFRCAPFTTAPSSATRTPASQSPKDLEGRKVGVNRGYTVTTGLWARSILQDEYGVDLSRITWVLSGDEHVAEYQPPSNVVPVEQGKKLEDLVLSGEVPAAIGVQIDSPLVRATHSSREGSRVQGAPRARALPHQPHRGREGRPPRGISRPGRRPLRRIRPTRSVPTWNVWRPTRSRTRPKTTACFER